MLCSRSDVAWLRQRLLVVVMSPEDGHAGLCMAAVFVCCLCGMIQRSIAIAVKQHAL